jgi:hypothetical protein
VIVKTDYSPPAHNEIRFDVLLAYVWPVVDSGEVNLQKIIERIREAIIEIVNEETKWKPYPNDGFIRSTGGDGRKNQPIHDEVIVYDFS